MTGKILKQMWHQRKINGWIFLELIIISFFLWKAIDPIYTITTLDNMDKGYNKENAFAAEMEARGTMEHEESIEDITKIVDGIKLNHMVEDASVTKKFSYPVSTSTTMVSYRSEESGDWIFLTLYSGYIPYAQPYLNITGYTDANTGKTPAINREIPAENICYLSSMAAAQLFPDKSNPVGKKVWTRRDTLTVAGVINDVTAYYGTYTSLIINFEPLPESFIPALYNHMDIIIKLKDNADPDKFRKHFMENEMQNLRSGNCRIAGIKSFDEIYTDVRTEIGIAGQTKLQYMLSLFFIACAFLGIAGTIWMKCNRRRSEIGLLRAMGSTKAGILKMFFTESAILVTLSYMIALIPLAAITLNSNEFMLSSDYLNLTIDNTSPYLYKRFLPHFGIVTILTYATLVGTAFLGTYITVHKYSTQQPSQALREE